MKKDEIAARIQAIGSKESVEDIRTELTALQEELETDYTTHENVVVERDTYKTKNEDLQAKNMDLYLKVTSREKDKTKDEPENKTLKFEDLFDEKGGLK